MTVDALHSLLPESDASRHHSERRPGAGAPCSGMLGGNTLAHIVEELARDRGVEVVATAAATTAAANAFFRLPIA